jgi:hypothetical protein
VRHSHPAVQKVPACRHQLHAQCQLSLACPVPTFYLPSTSLAPAEAHAQWHDGLQEGCAGRRREKLPRRAGPRRARRRH